jgi:5'-deoxynucleotidase YfbR-like HD superfamily hydrolase
MGHDDLAARAVTATTHLGVLADAAVRLGDVAMRFGQVYRTAVPHANGEPESNTDHTVMLGLVACALAYEWNDGLWAIQRIARGLPRLDIGQVAQDSLVHDLPEVKVGDTPTLRISDEDYDAKRKREHAAAVELANEFTALSWVGRTLLTYERQVTASSRFVRAVDKYLTRIVNILRSCDNLRAVGVDRAELVQLAGVTQRKIEAYAGEFTGLLQLGEELIGAMTEMM